MSASPSIGFDLNQLASTTDRTQLAFSVVHLLGRPLNDKEKHVAQDIMIRLLREAETQLRKTLATRLAEYDDCPKAILDFLINENPFDIAEPVLRYSAALSEDHLMDIAKKFQKTDYWRALAQRRNVSAKLASLLTGFGQADVCETLLCNPGAVLGAHTMRTITTMAQDLPHLQPYVLDRPEITLDLAHRLYHFASEALQAQIIERFNIDPHADLERSIDTLVYERTAQLSKVKSVSPDVLDLCFKLKMSNKIHVRHMMDALRKGQMGLYASLWAALLECHPSILLAKMESNFVTTHVVLVHAARMKRQEYNDFFFAWRQAQGHTLTQGHEAAKVLRAFDRMDVNKALAILASWKAEAV